MQDLVGRLTLDEMVAQMSHGGRASSDGDLIVGITWNNNMGATVYIGPAPGISRLAINPYMWRTVCDHGNVKAAATSFPQSIGMVTSHFGIYN